MKLARKHGVEDLLPHSIKGTEEKMRKRIENGLRVKGTGVGQRVKGKESERTLKGRYVVMHYLFNGVYWVYILMSRYNSGWRSADKLC